MLDVTSFEVPENTRKQITEWANQSHVKEGYLTIWEASCLLAYDQGASDLLCNNPNEKRLIEDFCALVTGDLTEGDKLEGYSGKLFNEIGAEAYPVIAFRTWFRRRRANNDHFVDWNEGHGRYFEQNARAFELQQTISSNEVSDAVDTVETAPDLDNMPSSLKEGIEPPLCDDVPTNEGDNKTKNYGVRFTVQQAVIKMFQLSEENLYWDSFEQEFTLFEVPQACELAMLEDVKRQKELVTFMGYEYVNPFNVKGNHQATFPREAFYEWWKANPHGIPCPEWFEDFLERDNPSPSLSLDDEEAPRSVQSGSGVGLDRFGGAVQFGRLTLRILELIQEWLEKPDAEKGEESKWRESLFRFIDCTALSLIHI